MAKLSPEKQKQKKANLTAFSFFVAACCGLAAALPFLEAAKAPIYTGPLILGLLIGFGLLWSWPPKAIQLGLGASVFGACAYFLFHIYGEGATAWHALAPATKLLAHDESRRALFWTGLCAILFAAHARSTGRAAFATGVASFIFAAGYLLGIQAPW